MSTLMHYLIVFFAGGLTGGGLIYWKYTAILAEKNALISAAQRQIGKL